MRISKRFKFDSAHHLPQVPKGHKCGRTHGHTWYFEVEVEGSVDPKMGWVIDYGDLSKAVKPLVEELDHRYLNHDVPGLENPTAENLARWLWRRLQPELPLLSCIRVFETCTSGCEYRGGED